MKNLIKGLAFLSMLSLFSCTKVLYTHEQVMNRYQSKQDVIGKFGMPAEKKTNGDGTESGCTNLIRKVLLPTIRRLSK
ncbi:MAG TPA: hypothetical protein VG367_16940 [Mucilaginibacter sp.]|jgi:hypothetical protein|nr:hypothetical protein [Mucilaginibacter sp.]